MLPLRIEFQDIQVEGDKDTFNWAENGTIFIKGTLTEAVVKDGKITDINEYEEVERTRTGEE